MAEAPRDADWLRRQCERVMAEATFMEAAKALFNQHVAPLLDAHTPKEDEREQRLLAQAQVDAAKFLDRAEKAEARIAELERERDKARAILADTDAASLPRDHTLELTARARINQMHAAEAEAARLRKAVEGARDVLNDGSYSNEFRCTEAYDILTAALSPEATKGKAP